MIDRHTADKKYVFLPVTMLILFMGLLSLPGCLPGSKPPQFTEQFTIEYAAPEPLKVTPVPYTIRIERFSTAQAYNSLSMVYQPEPYRLASYNYNRWRVAPGDMVTDYMVRDLRDSGIFIGVFTYRDMESTRFVLEGGVEEYLEVDKGKEGSASLSLNISLLDTTQAEITRRLIFQKRYSRREPLKEQAPASLARSMSAAMKNISAEIARDIYESVRSLDK